MYFLAGVFFMPETDLSECKQTGFLNSGCLPSGSLETFLAVKTLNLLGAKVKIADSVISFWEEQVQKGNLDTLSAAYLMVET